MSVSYDMERTQHRNNDVYIDDHNGTAVRQHLHLKIYTLYIKKKEITL